VGDATVLDVSFSFPPAANVRRSSASGLTFADEERPQRTYNNQILPYV
jgi:hypothetical protein